MHRMISLTARAFLSGATALALVACRAAPVGTTSDTPRPASTAPATPSVSATSSVSMAPLEACNTPPQDPKIWAVVRNNDQAQFVLQVVGRDGACNWPVKAGATGGVTVPAPSGTGTIRVQQATDCKVIGELDTGPGIYEVVIQSGAATIRPIQDTDALSLGEAPVGPCTPAG